MRLFEQSCRYFLSSVSLFLCDGWNIFGLQAWKLIKSDLVEFIKLKKYEFKSITDALIKKT